MIYLNVVVEHGLVTDVQATDDWGKPIFAKVEIKDNDILAIGEEGIQVFLINEGEE